MNTEKENIITQLAEDEFEARERLNRLGWQNSNVDFEEKKKQHIEYNLAQVRLAECSLALNKHTTIDGHDYISRLSESAANAYQSWKNSSPAMQAKGIAMIDSIDILEELLRDGAELKLQNNKFCLCDENGLCIYSAEALAKLIDTLGT